MAFLIARRPMSDAYLLRGEISLPICSWIYASLSVSISSIFFHSRSSPVIDVQAVATMDIYPSNAKISSIWLLNESHTSTTSAHIRFDSLYLICASVWIHLFGGFEEYSIMRSVEDIRKRNINDGVRHGLRYVDHGVRHGYHGKRDDPRDVSYIPYLLSCRVYTLHTMLPR